MKIEVVGKTFMMLIMISKAGHIWWNKSSSCHVPNSTWQPSRTEPNKLTIDTNLRDKKKWPNSENKEKRTKGKSKRWKTGLWSCIPHTFRRHHPRRDWLLKKGQHRATHIVNIHLMKRRRMHFGKKWTLLKNLRLAQNVLDVRKKVRVKLLRYKLLFLKDWIKVWMLMHIH